MDSNDVVIKVNNVSKNFHVGGQEVQVLKNISLEISRGDFVVIFGPSGSGKSTLLNVILGLEPPTEGSVEILGHHIDRSTPEDANAEFRKMHIGVVFQSSRWIKALNVRENVALPLIIRGVPKNNTLNDSIKILNTVGMLEWADYAPAELSSGQQQKVALARAMINNPQILFADEPTGNIDHAGSEQIMKIFTHLNKTLGKTIIMVTHNLAQLKYTNKAIKIFDGEVSGVIEGDEKEKFMNNPTMENEPHIKE